MNNYDVRWPDSYGKAEISYRISAVVEPFSSRYDVASIKTKDRGDAFIFTIYVYWKHISSLLRVWLCLYLDYNLNHGVDLVKAGMQIDLLNCIYIC